MNARTPRTEMQVKQNIIFGTLRHLCQIPKTSIRKELMNGEINSIWIEHENEYMPNFRLQWCPQKKHYRVYIHVGSLDHVKMQAGYSICVINSGLAAAGFVTVYSFIYKYRSNNKESN